MNRAGFSPHDHTERRCGSLPVERCALGELLDGGTQGGVECHWYQNQENGSVAGEKNCTRQEPLLSIVTSICVACPRYPKPLDSGPMSRTFLATLQYGGTGFVGWQRQPAGRSVQIEFERVLERL